MSFEKLKMRFPAATIDANGRLTIPALGATYPSKVALRVAASIANQAGKVLEIANPFPKPVVTPPAVTLTSITLTGPTTVNEGSSATYSVTGNYSNSTTALITSGITWSSNAPAGVLSPAANSVVGDGYTATVMASFGGQMASRSVSVVDKTVPVVVVPVTLTSIGISGVNQQNEGTSQTLKLSAVYSDGTSSQPTSGVVWGANTPGGVLAIPANSVVGDGHTETVTASFGGKTTTFSVQVVDTTVVVPPSAEQVYGLLNYNPEWAFVDDVSSQNLGGFFDDVLNVNVELNGGGGATQPGSVVVFRFPEQLGMKLAEVGLGDGQHDNPTGIECWTIDPVTKQRVYQFNFKGDTGNGVIDKHTLAAPTSTDAFLFRWGYPIPTEMKFYGWYTPYTPAPYVPDPVNIDGMAGYVSYIYDFCLPSGEGPDGIKLELSTCGSFYRLYVDAGLMYKPDTQNFTFSPCTNGAWDLDGVLDRLCRVLGMRVMICPKGQEGATWYPELCKQLAIRYGNNPNVADSECKVFTGPGYPANQIKKGLGVAYQHSLIFQDGNEPWRWWKGDADLEHQQNLEGNITPYESYVIQKACYDGIKSVSPSTEVSIGGTPSNAPGIVQGIIWYCDLYNGGNIVFDSVSYHDYLNTNGGQNAGGQPLGVQPELNNALYEHAMRFGRVLQQWAHGKKIKIYITETGWSTANHVGANPEQTAPPTATKDTFRVAADWVLRAGTEGARAGLEAIAGYQLYNDPNYLDNLDGYTNWDTSNGEAGQSPQGDKVFLLPASDAKKQRLGLLRGYFMVGSNVSDPEVRIHNFAKDGAPAVVSFHTTGHSDSTKVIQLPVPAGKTATLRTINFGVMSKAFAYVRPSVPIVTSNDGKRTVSARHPEYPVSQLEYMTNYNYQFQPYNGEVLTGDPNTTYQFRVKRLNPNRNVSFFATSPTFTANPGVTPDVVSVAPIASYNVYYDFYTPGTQVMDSQPLTITNGTVTVTASETQSFVVFS